MLRTSLLTVLAPVSWGTTYVVISELLPAGRPLLVAAARVVPAGLILLAVGAVGSRGARWRPRAAQLWEVVLLALCNFGVFFPLLIVAAYRLPGGVAASVGGLQPLLVAGWTWAVRGLRPRPRDLAVGAVAAVGVALIVVRPGAGGDVVGVLAAVGANVAFSLGVVLTGHFPTPPNRVAATGWQLLIGGVVIVPLMLAVEGLPDHLPAVALLGFGHLSLVATAGAFLLWFAGIRRLPPTAPPLLGLAAPVTGVVLGWLLLGQDLAPIQLLGLVVTLAAIGVGAASAAPATTAPATATAPSADRAAAPPVPTPTVCPR